MTNVNRYRDGSLSSTELMQDAMEKSGSVDAGEGTKLEWHADHESMEHARQRYHDQPTTVLKWTSAGVGGLELGSLGKTLLKDAPKLLTSPKAFVKDEAIAQGRWVARVVTAGGAAEAERSPEVSRRQGRGSR